LLEHLLSNLYLCWALSSSFTNIATQEPTPNSLLLPSLYTWIVLFLVSFDLFDIDCLRRVRPVRNIHFVVDFGVCLTSVSRPDVIFLDCLLCFDCDGRHTCHDAQCFAGCCAVRFSHSYVYVPLNPDVLSAVAFLLQRLNPNRGAV
jgi:hypothetical protein